MFQPFPLEEFKEVFIHEKLQLRYAISNYGRMISFTDTFSDGRLLKGSKTDGYRMFRFTIKNPKGKNTYGHRFLYKMVVEAFLPKTSEDQEFILHLDRNRANDHVRNLKWATKEEKLQHYRNSPFVQEAKKKLVQTRIKCDGNKLTTTQVIRLKKKLLDPNRKTRIKILAKKFGVSEMTLYRIKRGENWGHIKVW